MYKNEVIENFIPRKKTIEECNALKYNNKILYSDIKPNPNKENLNLSQFYKSLDYQDNNDMNKKYIYNKLIDEKDANELMTYFKEQPYYQNLPDELLYYYCKALIGQKLRKNDIKKIAKQEKKENEKFKVEEKINYRKKHCDFTLRFD